MSYDDDMGHDADVDIGFDSGASDDGLVAIDPTTGRSLGTEAFLAQINRTQKALADMQGIPPDPSIGDPEDDPEEDPGFLSGIGTLFTKGFDALGSFIDYTMANPISSITNTAINYSPIGMGANAISMATTGRSLAGHGSDMLGSLGLGVPSDVSPVAAGAQGVAQDIAAGAQGVAQDISSSLGGLFSDTPDPGAVPDDDTPGYTQKPGFAQGGLASLPQISHSGLYRAMGRG